MTPPPPSPPADGSTTPVANKPLISPPFHLAHTVTNIKTSSLLLLTLKIQTTNYGATFSPSPPVTSPSLTCFMASLARFTSLLTINNVQTTSFNPRSTVPSPLTYLVWFFLKRPQPQTSGRILKERFSFDSRLLPIDQDHSRQPR